MDAPTAAVAMATAILQPTIWIQGIFDFSAVGFYQHSIIIVSHRFIYAIDRLDKSNELLQYLAGAYGR